MAKSKTKQFPKKIFVQEYQDKDSKFLVADRAIEDTVDAEVGENKPGEFVGVYMLHHGVRVDTNIEVTELPEVIGGR